MDEPGRPIDEPTDDPADEVISNRWTPAALDAYRARADELLRRLAEHIAVTAGRHGRQREMTAYFDSADRLERAVTAFAEAEFDWCGSTPVGVDQPQEEADDDEDGPARDPSLEEAPVVSVLGRWDYVVTDAGALLDHGRSAYLETWPRDSDDDAAVRVVGVESAVGVLLHAAALPALDDAPGLQPLLGTVEVIRHAGEDEDDVLEDPFALRGR